MARKRSASKRTAKHARSAAPTKNTSGGGFGFETCVVAASLLDLLTEQPLNDVPRSRLDMVSAQKGPANWLCDDLLLSYATENDGQLLIPTSIKSFPTLSLAAMRDQFVVQAWNDALGEERRPRSLRLGHDRIGLFCTLHTRKLAHTITELIKKAREQGPDFQHNVTAPGHLAGGGTWLSRFACPMAVATTVVNNELQAFIASIELREFDFESSTSQSYRHVTNASRLATVSESHDDGRLLWQELCRVAEKLRNSGGDISRRRLIEELVGAPRLKEAPRFADTWRRLIDASERELSRQPRTIGRKIALDRSEEIQRLKDLAKNRSVSAVVICGPSGSGKSTTASLLCREQANGGRALWLPLPLALTLAEQSSSGVLSRSDSLAAVLTSVSSPEAWLILDGIDRATQREQFQALASILAAIGVDGTTPWKVVITCQQEHWPRVRRLFTDAGIVVDGWAVTESEPLSIAEVGQVTREVPAILPVVSQPRLRSFARRPMVLDLLVKAAEDGDLPVGQWIGETHLVDWFWDTRVRARVDIAGSQSLIELGRRQADLAELDTAVSDIVSQTAVEPLLKAGLLRERDERVVFDHDAVGDWARFRWLLSQGKHLNTVLEQRSTNPLWHSAIRLVASRQLEQSSSTDQWESLIDGCGAVTDFALDAVLFAADSENLLTRVADRLFANGAKLAKRMIRRAIIVCTTPDHWLLHHAAARLDSPTPFLRTISRDPRPFHFFWGPLLRFFGEVAQRLCETAPKEGAELSKVWLQMTPSDWPYRDHAAEIALSIAEQTWRNRQDHRRSISDEDAQTIYHAALAALVEQPTRAKRFFLQACSLELTAQGNSGSARRTRKRRAAKRNVDYERTIARWPDGPMAEVDEAFREACFEGRGMECLFRNDPALAEQMLLGLTIDVQWGGAEQEDEFSVFEQSHCDLIPPGPGLSAPHYQQGPFLDFLRIAPRQAISLILRVVNFASERAVARNRRPRVIRGIASPISENTRWYGNESVYNWNRARIDACARAVAPLTSLEKWLGDRIDLEEPVHEELGLLLTGANSVAIAGVLIDLGRRHPQLFDGPLRALLRSPLLLIWAEMQCHHRQSMLLGGPETRLGEWFFEEHKTWLFAEYRTRSILDDLERLSAAKEVRWEELHGTPFESAVGFSAEEGVRLVRQSGVYGRHQWMATSQGPEQKTTEGPERAIERQPNEIAIAEASACARALDGDFRLQDDSLATLHEELPDLRKELAGSSELQFLKRQARLGQATFLVLRQADWLKENGLWEEYLAYVIRETTDLDFFFASAQADPFWEFDWRSFLVPLAIDLWAAKFDDPQVRSWVAHLAVFATGRAKRNLIAAGFAQQQVLGGRLLSLIHLVLRSAAGWWEMEFQREHRKAGFDLGAWWSAELQNFMSRKLAAEVPALESLYLRDPPLHYANWRSDNRYGQNEDIFFRHTPLNNHNILAAVVHGTPLAALAQTDGEARERVALVRLALDAELAQLVAYDEAGNRLDIPCNEYPRMMGQRDVVERIAAELSECRDASVIAPLWQPVIGLGVTAPHWVEQLVGKWLWPKLAFPEFPTHVEASWQEVIRFASTHENWRKTSSATKRDVNELWSRLLGVDEYCFSLWRADHSGVIDRAAPLIEETISDLAASPRTSGPVLRWISRGPGRRFITVTLHSLSINLSKFLLDDRDDDQLINCMAEFLDVVWQVRSEEMVDEPSQWEAFRAVLRHVATAGNPLAIDLEQRVSGTA